jgi:NAD+ synthase
MSFNPNILNIDPASEIERIVSAIRQTVGGRMHKRGGVVGISGGVDSSVVLALSVIALGPEKVLALALPERDSDPESEALARKVANRYGIEPVVEVITPVLEGFGCYLRRDEAIRRVFPEYDAVAGYKAKIVLPENMLEEDTLNIPQLTIVTPEGEERTRRIPLPEYLQVVAASNFKQRTRMSMLYYHAELRNYAVVGTANKNEHGQGFFVKYGDGGVDIRPIIHLYKTQVYQLAEYLEIPEEIRTRTPTSDTYSAGQTQEEFFFRLPFKTMDMLWYAMEQGVPAAEAAETMGLSELQVRRAFADFTRKQRTTEYLRMTPVEFAPANGMGTDGH